ncbi:pleurocidin-like peptide WF3 [Sphaeramia orbicularis]|uniref:Pleurocidin-like peptide WF3 n=1 Tax=Sphaeramia orbicularis TaxID=375764 RepID=A0A673B1G0_9TELE|nr:pleurocidin-like peptide WF3 [Sphaeramia orbicularis]
MKCTAVFLVLSMVVFMADPGECRWGWLLRGAQFAGKMLHGIVKEHGEAENQQDQLDKRGVDYRPEQPGFN